MLTSLHERSVRVEMSIVNRPSNYLVYYVTRVGQRYYLLYKTRKLMYFIVLNHIENNYICITASNML